MYMFKNMCFFFKSGVYGLYYGACLAVAPARLGLCVCVCGTIFRAFGAPVYSYF